MLICICMYVDFKFLLEWKFKEDEWNIVHTFMLQGLIWSNSKILCFLVFAVWTRFFFFFALENIMNYGYINFMLYFLFFALCLLFCLIFSLWDAGLEMLTTAVWRGSGGIYKTRLDWRNLKILQRFTRQLFTFNTQFVKV